MIKHDYKPQSNQEFFKLPENLTFPKWSTHPYLIISMAICILALALVLSYSSEEDETLLTVEDAVAAAKKEATYSEPIDIPLEFSPSQPEKTISILPLGDKNWSVEAVKKGDNLSKIFARIGLTPQQLYKIINLDENTQVLKKLHPGEVISYQLTADRKLEALKYSINIQKTLYIESFQGELTSRIENKTIEYRTGYAHGTINDSLFLAGKDAGLTDTQVMQLANIFDWDIDFILDIRKGDSFSLIYEEKFLEGENIGHGQILAAEFINQGKTYKAVRYTDSSNVSSYYTPDGLSMRKAFLRAPLKFSYISSNFKPRRFHPILKRWKAHRGIDYRAATGTPIRAAGDGKVIASSYSKYNGKYVFIQHGQGIVTKYLHMSRRAVSKNKRVKQGQVIGYVGATGLAEAPHLHYEFVVNGVHRNPRTVSLPKAKPIAISERERFTNKTVPWIAQLNSRNSIINNRQHIAP